MYRLVFLNKLVLRIRQICICLLFISICIRIGKSCSWHTWAPSCYTSTACDIIICLFLSDDLLFARLFVIWIVIWIVILYVYILPVQIQQTFITLTIVVVSRISVYSMSITSTMLLLVVLTIASGSRITTLAILIVLLWFQFI